VDEQDGRPSEGAGTPKGSARTPWGSITREHIVDTAMRALREDGYAQMTIRNLASQLGVAPMSLYRHVRDKDDILDEVVERMLSTVWRPLADPSDWKRWIGEAAGRLRGFLVEEPAALHIYLSHPVVSPSAVTRMDAMVEVLTGALGTPERALRAYGAIQTYTIGFAALEASRLRWSPDERDPSPLARQLADYSTPRQFSEGVHYLLVGLESELAPAAAPPPAG
jgi:TetR/AcrR family tetracycline transcriptional repressor